MRDAGAMHRNLARKLPILAILALAVAGAILLRDRDWLADLAAGHERLAALRDAHYPLAVLAFMVAYAGIVALSLPGATIASLTGGLLFGLFPGVVFNVAAATAGACAVFLAARAGFGRAVVRRAEAQDGRAARLIAAFRTHQWPALLAMRLLPVVPFFLANLIPAFAGVRLPVFAATTFVGIIPAGLVFTGLGAGLPAVFAAGVRPDAAALLAPALLWPVAGLAVLVVLPLVLRRLRRGR